MKKTIIFLLVLMVGITTVLGGSIYDLDYKDKSCTDSHHCIDSNREINDNKVYVNADTVKGHDVISDMENYESSLNSVSTYISTNEGTWSQHGGGIGTNALGKLMAGDSEYFYTHETYSSYLDLWLSNTALNKKVLELEDRDAKLLKYIDALEKRVKELENKI